MAVKEESRAPMTDEEVYELKKRYRNILKKISRVMFLAGAIAAVFLFSVQSVFTRGLSPRVLWLPLTVYTALGFAFLFRRHLLMAGLCFVGLASHVIVLPRVAGRAVEIRETRVRSDLKALREFIAAYRKQNKAFPRRLEDLSALAPFRQRFPRGLPVPVLRPGLAPSRWAYDPGSGKLGVDSTRKDFNGKAWNEQ